MDKYNLKATCPKCGSDLVTTEYSTMADWMVRRCSNCSYIFYQEPLDKVKAS